MPAGDRVSCCPVPKPCRESLRFIRQTRSRTAVTKPDSCRTKVEYTHNNVIGHHKVIYTSKRIGL
jgi:hypothetical protein